MSNLSTLVIAYPAGKCPCKLRDFSYEIVSEWAEEISSEGRNKNIIYLPSAILFFAQQFYGVFTEEFKQIKNHLISLYGDVSFYDEEIKNQQNSLPKVNKNQTKQYKMSKKEKLKYQETLRIREKIEKEKSEENPKKIKLKRKT